MKRNRSQILATIALSFFLSAATAFGEEIGTDLETGPKIGEQISEFSNVSVSKKHLCWSCYG